MGDQLRVDPQAIRDAARQIDNIRSMFDSSGSMIDGYRDAVGQQQLADALHSFATNWRIHREHMDSDLRTFSDWANQVATGYEETDRKLSDALKQASGKGGHK